MLLPGSVNRRLAVLALLSFASLASVAAFSFARSSPDVVAASFGSSEDAAVEEVYAEIYDCLSSEGSGVDSSCSDSVAREQVARTNPATVLEAVRVGLERDNQLFEATCHNFMHIVGQVSSAYVRNFSELRAAAAQMTDVCQFGMYHGLVEGYADALPMGELRDQFPILCTAMQDVELLGRATQDYVNGECYHGIGHVAARRTSDFFEEGLGLCSLIEKDSDATSCATGVIMNWTDNAARWAQRAGSSEETPPQYTVVPFLSRWEVCSLVQDRFRPPCLLWMGSAAVSSTTPAGIRSDLSGYLEWCERFPDERSATACVLSVAIMAGDLATMSRLGGPAESGRLCADLAPPHLLQECLGQAAAVALAFIPPDQVRMICSPWHGTEQEAQTCAAVESSLVANLDPSRL